MRKLKETKNYIIWNTNKGQCPRTISDALELAKISPYYDEWVCKYNDTNEVEVNANGFAFILERKI